MTAHEHQIWTWVENISVVNLAFDFPSFAELNDNGLLKSLHWLLKWLCSCKTVTNFRMLKSLILLEGRLSRIYFQTMILRCCAARESLRASGSSRPPPPKPSGEPSCQAPYVTLLHTELGSPVRPIVSAAADGKTRWRTDFHRRRNIEVFEIFHFFKHNNRNCKGLR